MFRVLRLWLGAILRLFRSRQDLLVENLALRQHLSIFKRRNPRPTLAVLDKLFWVLARRFWCVWKESLLVVAPETVVRWHREGFRLYWSMISKIRKRVGRSRIPREVRDLIFRMVAENPTWCAPRIHGELLMLGFDVSERSVSRWMKRAPRDPELAQRCWPLFAIIAMRSLPWIFSPSPTVTFQTAVCFFIIISHDRRQIVHFNIARHPPAVGSCNSYEKPFLTNPPRSSCSSITIRNTAWKCWLPFAPCKIACVRTAIRSPWQNGVAERGVGSCRCDLLDHVIAVNERHLKRLLADYIHHHDDRTHLGLGKETPGCRTRCITSGRVLSHDRLGGLHHRYDREA